MKFHTLRGGRKSRLPGSKTNTLEEDKIMTTETANLIACAPFLAVPVLSFIVGISYMLRKGM